MDVFDTLDYLYIVLESLSTKIIEKTRFNETKATEISNLKVSSCVLKMTRIRLSRSQTWVSVSANSYSETNIEVLYTQLLMRTGESSSRS